MLNGRAISWESKRQKVTALSSAVSKFYAASACGCEIFYLQSVLSSMRYEQHGPTQVAEDNLNIACIYMLKSSAVSNKGKHINDGVMELYHVLTTEQAADMFTKALPSEPLKKHRQVFAGANDITIRVPGAQVGTEQKKG
eukprot:3507430-Rhodomonas_salina.3